MRCPECGRFIVWYMKRCHKHAVIGPTPVAWVYGWVEVEAAWNTYGRKGA